MLTNRVKAILFAKAVLLLGLMTNLSAVFAACLGDPASPKVLMVAVVPQLPHSVTYSKWAPFLDVIGSKSGLCFDLVIPGTIPAFEKMLIEGRPDFAFANPYHEVMAMRRQGYIPLVVDSKKLTGIIVVRKDSSLRTILDLDGKDVAFPAPNAFAASLLIRAELASRGVNIHANYLQTHANGYRAVAMGQMTASGGVNNTFQREDIALKDSLRVLYETSAYAPHPFIAHSRVQETIRNKVTLSILSLVSSDAGKKILEGIQIPLPERSDYDRDFLPIEKLDLDKFMVLDVQ